MPEPAVEPSAVVWRWRAGDDDARRQEIAAARRRGAIGGAVGLAAAAGALLLHRPVLAGVVAALALAAAVLAFAAPLTLYKRLSRLLEAFAHAVGAAVTWVLMTVLYFLLFLPVGLVLRATGKLAFTRFREPDLATYWKPADERPVVLEQYRKQF
jgi:hypothetical protein